MPRLVKGQQPISAFLQGLNDQQGQFVFRKKVLNHQTAVPKPELEQTQEPAEQVGDVWTKPQGAKPSAEEEIEWRIARRMDSTEAYGRYLSIYPEGYYSREAANKIHQKATKVWGTTPKNDSGYRQFMEQFPYPGIPSYEEAKKALAKSASRSWFALQQQLNLQGLRDFISNHPESIYMEDAKLELEREEQVIYEVAKRRNEPQLYIKAFSFEAFAKRTGLPLPEMLLIKGGEFMMGSNQSDKEKPIHSVQVSDFYLGKYEVTNAQYAAFLNVKGNQNEGGTEWYNVSGEGYKGYAEAAIQRRDGVWVVKEGRENHPVNYVSWYGAMAYGNWLGEQTGQLLRLPTESEWEYAAGGGTNNRTLYAGTNVEKELGEFAWYTVTTKDTGTRPVGQKQPNGLGLYDMSGNVWEWCADWYREDYYKKSPSNNPKGPSTGADRVVRGGSWSGRSGGCRVAARGSDDPGYRNNNIGFRLARQF